ncbi:hypothetical protein QTP86_003934, partial [Hemibagrus guttatus]
AAPDAPNPSPPPKVLSSDGSWRRARNVERPVGGARSRARHLGGEREAKARRVGGSEYQGEASGGNEDQGEASGGSEKQERDKWGEQRTRRQGQRVRRDVHSRAEAPNDVHSRAAEPGDYHSRAAGPSNVHRRAAASSDVHRRALAPSDVHRRTTAPGRRCPSRWGLELPKGREGGSKVQLVLSSADNSGVGVEICECELRMKILLIFTLCLISGEDSFELHSVDLELEVVEKQIRDLQVKQTQLRQRKAVLESSWTDAHLSQVNSRRETITPTTSTPCASLPRPSARTRPTQVSFTPAPGYHAAWMQQQRKTRAKPRARTSPPPPPPIFEIPTQNRFAPLRETACDAVIIGDSIVRHVRATAAKGKVHTRCLPGARVLDVSAQVPAILKKNIGAVVLHAGTNDIRLRQTEILKKDFRSLVELVRTTSPTTRIIVSGPLPTFQQGIERFSRL